jgi:predicted N-acyltransferase
LKVSSRNIDSDLGNVRCDSGLRLMTELRIRVIPAIGDIEAAQWDACAGFGTPHGATALPQSQSVASISACLTSQPEPAPHTDTALLQVHETNPFTTHDFLSSLETSGSVGGRTGWLPQHVLAEQSDGTIGGVAPCYLKTHSRGEYVFDRGWAEAYENAGGSYYPKLQVAVPFTPASGRRLLMRPGNDGDTVRHALVAGLVELCRLRGASSVHVTFATEPEAQFLGELGFLHRTDQQFHWQNAGYATFDDFLDVLAARKRKAIRRERREAVENGIAIHWLTGSDLTESVWDAFFTFYMETGSRKWGRPYLTRPFYSHVSARMADRIVLIMARRAGRWIAGAINFIGSHTLFGRHWGAVEYHPFLHFELCYYQAIEFAIARRLVRVEAGAQGEHKLARGYMPCTTHSAHYIADPALRRAIADYLKRERAYVAATGAELTAAGPFRKDLATGDA